MPEDNTKEPWWKPAVAIFSAVSGWIVVPLILASLLGKNLDAHFETEPWIFLGATCVGFLISSFGIVRITLSYIREIEKNGKNSEIK